ncbi:MAG: amidase family protein [Candidatus Methylomirabilia bacterium]
MSLGACAGEMPDQTASCLSNPRPRNTLPFDLISVPAISVPCGFTKTGLTVGLQIVGKAFDERGVLRVARAYEQATAWHTQHPAL